MHAKRRRAFTISATAAALLVVPAAAEAATYKVEPQGGACGGADMSCGSLTAAADAVGAGDTVQLFNGIYGGATFDVPDIKVVGAAIAPAALPTSQVDALKFTGGGTAEVSNVALSAASGPGIDAQGTTGISLTRSLLLATAGNGISVDEGASVKVTTSRVIASSPGAAGIQFLPATAGARTVTLDSSIISGGGGGSGLRVENSGAAPGPVTIDAKHVTLAGANSPFSLSNTNAVLGGDITATVTDSIVSGTSQLNKGLLKTVTLDTATRNDTASQPLTLFVNPASRDYSLLATSPVIGKGANAGANELDVDGQPRDAGQPTDLGADEFVNTAPVAKAAAVKPEGRQNRPVAFSAAGSADRDGPLLGYVWTFSDGQKTTTRTPTVEHAFAKEGRAGVALQVVDTSGAVSPAALAAVNILDGVAPLVGIDTPKNNKTLKRTKTSKKTGKKTKQAIKITGRAADKSGMKQVLVTIKQVSRTSTKAKKSQSTSKKTCRWVKRVGISVRSCDNPVLIGAKLASGGKWTYTIPASRIPVAGTYEVSVIGVDKTGAFGNSAPAKSGKVKFKLK